MLTDAPPRKCLKPGCPNIGQFADGRGYCPEHSGKKGGGHVKRPMESGYNARAYRDRHAPRMKSLNPICQRIVDGEQCRNPSTVLHHLKDPQTARELYDPRNAVMLCAGHHPGGAPGTPWWVEGTDYVSTLWTEPNLGGNG